MCGARAGWAWRPGFYGWGGVVPQAQAEGCGLAEQALARTVGVAWSPHFEAVAVRQRAGYPVRIITIAWIKNMSNKYTNLIL